MHNPDWRSGMGSSLAAGLRALDETGPGAAVIALADQPLVGAEAVRRLIAAYQAGASVAVAAYAGKPRNPVLIAREHWAASEDPMPERQSGLCTARAPSISTGAAPVTTSTGSAPPARSTATPRSASVCPPSSTSALGRPSREPSPAASKIPATVATTPPRYARATRDTPRSGHHPSHRPLASTFRNP